MLTYIRLFDNKIEAQEVCHFALDNINQITPKEKFTFSGWIIGKLSPAILVKLIREGQVISEAPIHIYRPNAAKIYSSFPGSQRSGFHLQVDLNHFSLGTSELEVQVDFQDLSCMKLGVIRIERKKAELQRKKTFFIHVPKTAGSSFNKFLLNNFYGDIHCEQYWDLSSPLKFKELDLLNSFEFISGHLNIQYFDKNFNRDDYWLVTILRNPIDQLMSHVNWVVYISEDINSSFFKKHPEHIKQMSLEIRHKDPYNYLEIIDVLLKYQWLFKNNQSSCFQSRPASNPSEIIDRLLTFDLVGLTEYYEQFIADYINLTGTEATVAPTIHYENKNKKPALNKKELLKIPEFADFLHEYNAVDIEVYNYFLNRFKDKKSDLNDVAKNSEAKQSPAISYSQPQNNTTQIVENNKPLVALVCGYERGGTTLVNQILKQHPQLDSGFECGFLLVDKISDFLSLEPYRKMLRPGWGVVDSEIEFICSAENWAEVYKRLQQKSRLIKNKEGFLFDKTPRYMLNLPNVLRKVPNIPCIVVVRDPRALMFSWGKREGISPKKLRQYCQSYLSSARAWKTALEEGFGNRILLVRHELLCLNPATEVEKIFNFIGFDFDPDYLNFKPDKNQHKNVYSNQISADYIAEYKKHFSDDTCRFILEKTEEFKEWHFNAD